MSTYSLLLGLFCTPIGLALAKIQIGGQGVKQGSFERFDGSCPGHNVVMTYELQGLRVEGSKLWLNSTVIAKEDVLGDSAMSISIHRCKSQDNLDTCEPFHNFKTNKLCAMLQSGAGLWGPYFGAFTPALRCPIKKGVYQGINGMIDLSAFLLINRDDWFWKTSAEIRQKRSNRLLMCMFIDVYITSG